METLLFRITLTLLGADLPSSTWWYEHPARRPLDRSAWRACGEYLRHALSDESIRRDAARCPWRLDAMFGAPGGECAGWSIMVVEQHTGSVDARLRSAVTELAHAYRVGMSVAALERLAVADDLRPGIGL